MKLFDLKQECDRVDHKPVYEFLLGTSIVSGRSLRSPIRRGDKNPSFNVFRSRSGKWLWKDFAYGEGDVYDLVQIKYGCDFPRAVRIVAERLGIQEDQLPLPKANGMVQFFKKLVVPDLEVTDCWYENAGADRTWLAQGWCTEHHTRLSDIENYDWVAVEWGTVSKGDRQRVYTPATGASMFAIHINNHIKFYRPGKSRPKYIGNTTAADIYGFKWLTYDPARPTVLVGGHKDALMLLLHAGDLVQPICMNSESQWIQPDQMDAIMERSSELMICYDNDEAGWAGQKKLREAFPFMKALDIPIVSNLNDIADVVTQEGVDTLRQRITSQLP